MYLTSPGAAGIINRADGPEERGLNERCLGAAWLNSLEDAAMAMKIARVESFRIAAQRDYEGSAGLRPAAPKAARAGTTALNVNTGRHLCVYPAQAEALLVRIVTDDGLIGWGEAHHGQ